MSILTIFMLLASCRSEGSTTSSAEGEASSGEVIKVGMLFSLSSTTALIEECMTNAALLTIEAFNKV